MRIVSVLLLILIATLYSCNEVNPKGEDELKEFVNKWNANHTPLRNSFLKQQYMDEVQYYGVERTKEIVAVDKKLLFEEFPDYTQTIIGDIEIIEEAGSFLATFDKNVTYNEVKATYTCFLAVIYKNGEFRILREGVTGDAKLLEAPIFPNERLNNAQITKNPRLYGDFNGDELSDYASVESPVIMSQDTKIGLKENNVVCKGDCKSIIRFSVADLMPFTIDDAYNSQIENLRDLNGDGADEIGFWNIKPDKKLFYILDVMNHKLITPPLYINTEIHPNLKLIDVIKKSSANKIRVTESVEVNGKWKLESRLVVVE